MHELALTRSLIGLVEQEAKKQGFKRALEIRLKVGAYSGVVPDYILDLFPHASEGTACEGAALSFETVPAAVGVTAEGFDDVCAGTALTMTAGREFYVDSLKVE